MSATYVRAELQFSWFNSSCVGVTKIWIFCLQEVSTEGDDASAGTLDYNLFLWQYLCHEGVDVPLWQELMLPVLVSTVPTT